ncbi:hypothetical protein EYW49_20620 [Siculibacillus lacustris]|uniref:Uncharacterized protein n=1 Tax=Siculibacillus lacustris TaxID=1549641 RepID=A0A4Q9VG31_9HYPH|nr:hypothetical protein [Siculibacillus lacustris]TBW33366.1 hypothetical protein EYW49_20620 [Siculibacillus lacustris]
MHGTVSLTRAAELLTEAGDPVTRSTLSRYVKQHGDALAPSTVGRETVVDYEDLAAHRAENIRLAAKPAPTQKADSSRSEEAAGNLRAQRRLRELELGEREGHLTLRREVEEAAVVAVSSLRNAFSLAVADTSEAIAATVGVEARLIRPHLRAFERKGLEAFIRNLIDHGLLTEAEAAAAE